MKKQLTQAERAALRLKILRTAKNYPEFEKILLERMKQSLKKGLE
jgi:hypothetical protein